MGNWGCREVCNCLLIVTSWSDHCDRVPRTPWSQGSELRLEGWTAQMKSQALLGTRGVTFILPSSIPQVGEMTFLPIWMVAPAMWPGTNWWGAQLSKSAATFINCSFSSICIKAVFLSYIYYSLLFTSVGYQTQKTEYTFILLLLLQPSGRTKKCVGLAKPTELPNSNPKRILASAAGGGRTQKGNLSPVVKIRPNSLVPTWESSW